MEPATRPIMWHHLKTWPAYFNPSLWEWKPFEVRKNDRDFWVSDYVVLEEWSPETESYTGRTITRQIQYVLTGGQLGIEPGYCVLGLKNV